MSSTLEAMTSTLLNVLYLLSTAHGAQQQLTQFANYELPSTGQCGDHASVFEVGVVSVIQCILTCRGHINCGGAAYNTQQKICQGYLNAWHGTACASDDTTYWVKGSGVCPAGSNSCYLFSSEEKTWQGAVDTCARFSAGMLAEVNDAVEDGILSERCKALNDGFWIGLTDAVTEGRYVWETSRVVAGYTGFRWLPEQPAGLEREDCVLYGTNNDFHWADARCNLKMRYICEIKTSNIGELAP